MWGRASSAPRSVERLAQHQIRFGAGLAERRRTRRRRALVFFFILLLLPATVYGLRQSVVRISHVEIFGADSALSAYATNAMQGSYFGVIPRDSTFFFPEERIRSDILNSDKNIAAVSIFRNGLTGLSIKIDTRAPIARWCGSDAARSDLNASSSRFDLIEPCYVFDANGFIYSAAASTTQTINAFTLYAPLDIARGEPPAVSEVEPLRATIAHAEKLPATFDFARQLVTLGSPVASITIHDSEVDDYLASGTRITYVLGDEQNAYTALVSARDNFNLSDGSVDYVDLRFDGKVYVKKKSATVSQ